MLAPKNSTTTKEPVLNARSRNPGLPLPVVVVERLLHFWANPRELIDLVLQRDFASPGRRAREWTRQTSIFAGSYLEGSGEVVS